MLWQEWPFYHQRRERRRRRGGKWGKWLIICYMYCREREGWRERGEGCEGGREREGGREGRRRWGEVVIAVKFLVCVGWSIT